jgi:hypothetical protein
MDPGRCVPLRDSYEVFGPLKATGLAVNGEIGYRVVNDPELYRGFIGEGTLWMGGAATKQGEWTIFLANKFNSGWFGISSFRPEGMNEQDTVRWREEIIELLETFYGYIYRR